VKAFDEVMEKYPPNPKTPEAAYYKACALMNNKEKTAAGKEFKNFIAKYPDNPKVTEAHKHLRELGLEAAPGDARTKLCRHQPSHDSPTRNIAGMMEHPVLPAGVFAEEDVRTGCEIARQYAIAAVTVRPSDVDLAMEWMKGSGVAVASVVGYPHGCSTNLR